ncbi:MAG: hypothetical protein R6U38_03570 [Desulfatiglandaceae bacterium]
MWKQLRFIIMMVVVAAVMGFSMKPVWAGYYVTESRSGIIIITDHEPQSGGTVLKGPFDTREAAEEALSPEEKERLGTRGQGRGQGKGRGKGPGHGQGKGQGKNR